MVEAREVFDLSEDEVVDFLLPEPPSEMESVVTDAVLACPKRALRVISD